MGKKSRPILKQLFEIRGTLDAKTKTMCLVFGSAVMLVIWIAVTQLKLISPGILPSPIRILFSFSELHFEDALVRNAAYSFYLNSLGCLEAVAIAIPLGFLIGLLPVFRSTFEPYISASRFLPLTAVLGLFVGIFGIYSNMKAQFLAFSIFIYLLPVVIQKIDEVEEVYDQTVLTLGATTWQRIWSVYIPAVISRVYDDIRVLAALSWTYIIVAELVNTGDGGVGALAYLAGRQTRTDKVFAILVTIILIGLIQDKILVLLEKYLFPYKYATKGGK